MFVCSGKSKFCSGNCTKTGFLALVLRENSYFLRELFDCSSTVVRPGFGSCSRQIRDRSETGSGGLRVFFDCCSADFLLPFGRAWCIHLTVFRTTSADSDRDRRPVEASPKNCRTWYGTGTCLSAPCLECVLQNSYTG